MLVAQADTFPHQGKTRIGLNAAQLPYLRARQLRHHLVIYAGALDAAAAVDQQHPFAPVGGLTFQVAQRAFAKVDLGRILKHKVNHKSRLLYKIGETTV